MADHSLVTVQADTIPKSSPDKPFHRSIFRYTKANWNSFRFYMGEAPLSTFFKHTSSKIIVSEYFFFIYQYCIEGIKYFNKNCESLIYKIISCCIIFLEFIIRFLLMECCKVTYL